MARDQDGWLRNPERVFDGIFFIFTAPALLDALLGVCIRTRSRSALFGPLWGRENGGFYSKRDKHLLAKLGNALLVLLDKVIDHVGSVGSAVADSSVPSSLGREPSIRGSRDAREVPSPSSACVVTDSDGVEALGTLLAHLVESGSDVPDGRVPALDQLGRHNSQDRSSCRRRSRRSTCKS